MPELERRPARQRQVAPGGQQHPGRPVCIAICVLVNVGPCGTRVDACATRMIGCAVKTLRLTVNGILFARDGERTADYSGPGRGGHFGSLRNRSSSCAGTLRGSRWGRGRQRLRPPVPCGFAPRPWQRYPETRTPAGGGLPAPAIDRLWRSPARRIAPQRRCGGCSEATTHHLAGAYGR
jgi:hypothetical protein